MICQLLPALHAHLPCTTLLNSEEYALLEKKKYTGENVFSMCMSSVCKYCFAGNFGIELVKCGIAECGMRKVKCGIQKCGNVCGMVGKMWNLDPNCQSEHLVNVQIALFLDACCAILMF